MIGYVTGATPCLAPTGIRPSAGLSLDKREEPIPRLEPPKVRKKMTRTAGSRSPVASIRTKDNGLCVRARSTQLVHCHSLEMEKRRACAETMGCPGRMRGSWLFQDN